MKKKILVAVFAILVFNIVAAVAGSNSADEEFLQYIQQALSFYEKAGTADTIASSKVRACCNGPVGDCGGVSDTTIRRCRDEANATAAAAVGDTLDGYWKRADRVLAKADDIFRNNKLKKQTLSKAKKMLTEYDRCDSTKLTQKFCKE